MHRMRGMVRMIWSLLLAMLLAYGGLSALRTFVREPGRSPQDVVPCDRLP